MPPSSSTISIVKCKTIKCTTTLHPPSPLFIYYPNSQMYDTSSTIPPLHLLSQQSNVRLFVHHPSCSSTIPIVKCTTLRPPCPLFIYYLNSQMYDNSSTIPLFIYYPNSQMYDTSSTIPPVHLLSQQSNIRHFIHHPPCSSTIPIVKCTTPHPPSRLFIYYPNSQMYDTSSTIPSVHLLSQQSNVRHFIHHPPCSSTIPIVKCTTLDPPSPLFIYYPNSQMYDTSSTIPPLHLLSQQSNVRLFVHHPSCSSTIPIVKCTTLRPPCPLFIYYLNSQMYDNSSTIPLFIYYPNSQMYDTSSTIPPVHLLSQQSNVRHLIHHTPFIYYPSSQMYDTSSTIPPVQLLSQQSNVRHLIHHTPLHLLSQQSNVRHLIHHTPFIYYPNSKCTTLHPPSPLFIYYPNSQMYDTSSTIPPVHLLFQQSNVRHFIHHPPVHLSQQSNRHFNHPPVHLSIVMYDTSSTIPLSIYYPDSQMYDTLSTIPLFIYYPNSQMYDASSTMPPLHLLSQQSNVRHFIHNPPCSSTISIVKCTTLHPPFPLHLLFQQSNVRRFIHHAPLHLLS